MHASSLTIYAHTARSTPCPYTTLFRSPPPSEPPPSEGPVPPSDPESSLQAAMPRAAVAARAVDSRERRRINAGAFRIGCPGGGARAPGYGLGPEELSGRRSGLGGSGHVYGPEIGRAVV